MSIDGHQRATKRTQKAAGARKDAARRKGEGPEPVDPGGSFTCTVNRAGPAENGNILIHLRETSGKFDRWFTAHNAVKKEMLATALTAISTGLKVSAFVTTTDEYGTLNRLYITR
jgi:hypothetical protein